jgi:co-chaperonin GroES (HSP10)
MSKLNITATHNRVFVKPSDEKSAAGLILPTSENQKFVKGVVGAAGPGVYQNGVLVPMSCKPGDNVLYINSKNEVKIDGEVYIVISDADVLCVYP